jgi:hypothetical protein
MIIDFTRDELRMLTEAIDVLYDLLEQGSEILTKDQVDALDRAVAKVMLSTYEL